MKQRKIYGGITTVLVALLLVALIMDLMGVSFWTNQLKDGSSSVPEAYAEQITTYDNGDFVYSYTEEQIVLDEDESVIYVDDLVDVFLTEELSKNEKQKLAAQVNGTIVTDISGIINMMQILVDAADYNEICQYAEILNENETVRSATYDVPYFMEETLTEDALDRNGWGNSTFIVGNEGDQDGNNWWAEAIGAYTAWSYEDYFQSDVTIGIIDTGFQLDHPDLDSIQMLSGYNNSPSSHGTFVASIICALDNDIGLRGVASSNNFNLKIYGFDWTPVTEDIESEEYVECLTSGTFIEAIITSAIKNR